MPMVEATFGISIHAPRTGSDWSFAAAPAAFVPFQSTLPARGATGARNVSCNRNYFNPRSPHGERHRLTGNSTPSKMISIHAPRTGSDAEQLAKALINNISIHAPRTGSDKTRYPWTELTEISIHAPRTGSDLRTGKNRNAACYFNPRSPHGERRLSRASLFFFVDFNPRSPHGERQGFKSSRGSPRNFNPRSPHGERLDDPFDMVERIEFQSTLPARGATVTRPTKCNRCEISIHAPRTGSDAGWLISSAITSVFQSTLPARGATPYCGTKMLLKNISIHAPRTGSDLPGRDFRCAA